MESQPVAVFGETVWNRERLDGLATTVAGESPDELTVRAPTIDEPIGSVPNLDEAAIERAVAECRDASEEWAARDPSERATVLDRFADLVETNMPELLDLVQLETGKARRDAVEEAVDVPMTASYYAEKAPAVLAPERRRGVIPLASTAEVVYDPVGVVGVISPWNYPLTLSMTDLLAALAAGNGVVLKPDEKTPFIALRLGELLVEAGLPPALCQVVTGEGPTVGPALIDRVDHITFTGSTETGRIVAEQAGRNLIDCSMELGGKNPMVVLADADPQTVARGALQGCFGNAGQLCLAMERIYVEEPLFEPFLDAFVDATTALELGTGFGYEANVGSLIDEAQLDRVSSHVEDARERGATVHAGGRERPDVGPFFYEPTILTDVPDESLPACEETFGPVVSVEPVESAQEGVAAANDSPYGLNASVWTGDRERGREIARQIECGTVCVNDAYAAGWAATDAPMGGFGDSGIGRRHGPEGLLRYTEPKTVATSRIGPVEAPGPVSDRLFSLAFMALTRVNRRVARALR